MILNFKIKQRYQALLGAKQEGYEYEIEKGVKQYKAVRDHWANFLVHSLAVASYLARLVLQSWAISGTRGSSGLASVSSDEMESRTLEIVRAGDHWSFRMSRQMDPLALMLGWQILVVKLHLGGLKGQSVGKVMLRKKTPPEYGLSSGPTIVACQWKLSPSTGPAEQLAGGSFWRSLSSLVILFWAISLLNQLLKTNLQSIKISFH